MTACDVQAAITQLTARYEADFFDDMASLNVLPPSAITRVSDYVPEIISYIEKIGEKMKALEMEESENRAFDEMWEKDRLAKLGREEADRCRSACAR